MVQITELLCKIEDDTSISTLTEHIVDVATTKSNRLTIDQISNIAGRLESALLHKFPCVHGIQHDGYRIYCAANIGRIQKSTDWTKLIADAKKIPNLADRGFVLAKIASHLPPKHSGLRDQLLAGVVADATALPGGFDRAQALSNVATIYESFDKSKCKKLLVDAMACANESEPVTATTLRRNLIDLSHRIDPDLAQELVSGMDDDPVRIRARLELQHDLNVLAATRDIQTQTAKKQSISKPGFRQTENEELNTVPSPAVLPAMAWRALAQLNGGVGIAYSPSELKDFIAGSSALPLSESFPVLNWALSCASKLYANTDQAGTILRQLFDSTCASATLCLGLIARCSVGGSSRESNIPLEMPTDSFIIHAGDSEAAQSVIHEWIIKNVKEFLLICDPYLNVEDIAILRSVLETRLDVAVTFVTDLSRFDSSSVADQFNAHWRQIMAVPPPATDIVLLTTESSGTFPIHDRWWITKDSGLRVGTSLSGLGARRTSEISEIEEGAAKLFREELEPFVSRQVRSHAGERLKFLMFTLE